MTAPEGNELDSEAAQRVERFRDAGLLAKAGLIVTGRAPDARERELARRHALTPEERIAEDVIELVRGSLTAVELALEHGFAQDLSAQEYRDLNDSIVGRSSDDWSAPTADISLLFAADEVTASAIGAIMPGGLPSSMVDGHRYATLTDIRTGTVEPFLLALTKRGETNELAGALLLDPTFVRYEHGMGSLDTARLPELERVVTRDLLLVQESCSKLQAIEGGNSR